MPATVTFTIHPPFWRRWWFVVFGAAVIAAGLYAAYRYRVARLVEVERVRTRIATDLHDDLGANLSQIAILSEVTRARISSDDPEIASPLARIASLSRESVDAMSDIVWAIDPLRDQFTDLATRIRRLANELLPPRGIDLRFRASEVTEIPMGADVRREVFLVFKESVNNIVRHAGCTAVDVTLGVDRHRLRLEVRDNGHGFNPADSRGGQGITSMRRRAEGLGGDINITSQVGAGTSVRLTVPRKHAGDTQRHSG
jgi:signal transduction histidine kinase